jgi:outer membrane protein
MSIATMKKLLWVVVMGLVVTGTAHAETKIALVNFQRVFVDSPQSAVISQAIQAEFGPRDRDLQQKGKDLEAMQADLQRNGATMTEAARTSLEKNFAKGQRDFKAQQDALKEDYEARNNEEIQKLQGQLINEIRSYGKANGYDMVLSSTVVFYAADSYDITNQVLAYLKAKSPDGTKPAAPATKPAAPATKPAK